MASSADVGSGPPQKIRLRFTVETDELGEDEALFVVGSVPELGMWEPADALALLRCPDTRRWIGSIETSEIEVKFRYFSAYNLCSETATRLIVSRWESFLQPRSCMMQIAARDGEARAQVVDIFGFYAGRRLLSDGWLQYEDENAVFIRIHGKALKFYNKQERKNCQIKCTPLDVRRKMAPSTLPASAAVDEEMDDDSNDMPLTDYPSHSVSLVAVLSSDKSSFRRQKEQGVVFNNLKDYVVFKTHSVAVDYLAFLLEVFSEEGKRIGACYAMPASLEDTFGRTGLPIVNSQLRPIGQIMVEYLFVRNLRRPHLSQTMEVSFCHHWKKRGAIEVGHRGMGNSYTKMAQVRENTVHSLNQAARNGADFVEFDVQMTKDKKAVIYHDFHVLVSVAKRLSADVDLDTLDDDDLKKLDFQEMPLKDLKLSQLRLLMMNHLKYDKIAEAKKLCGDDFEEADHRPFPLLSDALVRVDIDVGFNIEVKYPMMQADGTHECDNYFERNEFVDYVLADVLKYAGQRRIMFSSFDPDICSLIALKQNRYPCSFLCIGDTQRYVPFTDQRTSTSMTAVNFASGIDLLGVNFNSEDLLKDPLPVLRANELGLVTFVWGDDLDRKDICHYFKRELGVDGVIYDRIGEEERRRNVFIVEREQKRALFKYETGGQASGSSTPRARSPDSGMGQFNLSTGSFVSGIF
ncbi:unnamed protein product, partial [Mesorhabditis spiculigera]